MIEPFAHANTIIQFGRILPVNSSFKYMLLCNANQYITTNNKLHCDQNKAHSNVTKNIGINSNKL